MDGGGLAGRQRPAQDRLGAPDRSFDDGRGDDGRAGRAGVAGHDLADGRLGGQRRGGGVDAVPGAHHSHERDRLRDGQDPGDHPGKVLDRPPEQAGRYGDHDVGGLEHLLDRQTALGAEHSVEESEHLTFGELPRNLGVPAGELDGGDEVAHGPTRLGQFGPPARHQLPERGVALDLAVGPGGDVAGAVAVGPPGLDRLGDLSRPLRVLLEDLVGDPGDPPVAQPARGAGVGLDAVAQLDRHPGGSHPPGHGGGVDMVPPQDRVGGLPAALTVEHFDDIGDQYVIVGAGVARPGGGVAGVGVDQAAGGGLEPEASPAAAPLIGHALQVGEGGVPFGVEDSVHVLGPADHPQLGHRLVRRDDELHPRPPGCRQALPAAWLPGTAGAVDGGVLRLRHPAVQP